MSSEATTTAAPAADSRRAAAERRLVAVVGAVVFVDTMFYAAIAPLLPALAHSLHLSKLSAGVLTACYPIGTLAAAVPGGILAVRFGPKRTVYVGLALLACSTLAFGFVQNIALLDAARLLEGIGGACSWAGGLAWIVAEAPPRRRGALLGAALGAAIGGALFGPVIGTIAGAVGRAPAFSAVMVLSLGLIAWARQIPLTRSASGRVSGSCGRPSQTVGCSRACGWWRFPRRSRERSTCWRRSGCTASAPGRPESEPPSSWAPPLRHLSPQRSVGFPIAVGA